MTSDEVKSILQIQLNMIIPATGRTEVQTRTVTLLDHLVSVAIDRIKEEGLEIHEGTEADPYTSSEGNLIVMYASYLYRERVTHEGMPRMLRYALNNAIFSQKAST